MSKKLSDKELSERELDFRIDRTQTEYLKEVLAQRTWVGLTYEEIDYQAKKDDHGFYFALGALWAEVKLRSKNGY